MAKGDGNEAREAMKLRDLMAAQDPAKMQKLSLTMTEAMAESQALINAVMGSAAFNIGESPLDPFDAAGAFAEIGQSLAVRPDRILAANLDLWQGWMKLWSDMALPGHGTASRDKRFSDPEWSENPLFDFMRRTYELNTTWLMSLIEGADTVGEATRRKARFFARQTADAFAPTNFFATNPAALKLMIESGGDSVLQGLRQAREDLAKHRGHLTISQSDETPFEVGRNIATTPGKVAFRNDLIELIHYAPVKKRVRTRPLLIFPPWINKFYILDLREENSMIRWLLAKGIDVYLVSWRSADDVTRNYTWDDYVTEGVFAAVEATLAESGSDDLNTIGYCIGGTLLAGALAYMAKHEDARIASATFFASQADFEKGGDLLVFTDEPAIAHVREVIAAHGGLMPGELMRETFNWLRPIDLVWRYVVDNYMLGKKPRPFDLLYWNADQTNIPGPTHLTYLENLYQRNELGRGRFRILGERIDLGDVTIPVTVQASRDDHICPFDSVYRAASLYGGPVQFILAGSGHIAGVVNHPDAKKYQHWTHDGLPGTVEEWMAGAEEHPGSWWPTWWTWLKDLSGPLRAAPVVADKGLGDAPGSYVKVRLEDIHMARGT